VGARDPFLNVRPDRLDDQLARLMRLGFRAVELSALFENGRPRRNVMALTFDDGFENVFLNGLPVLARHKVSAIQFVVAGLIGKLNEWDIVKRDVPERLMDEAQIREWLLAGHQIGSHSMTHRNLKKLSAREAREEIFASRKRLEDLFGIEVRHFCYPFGGCNPEVQDLVEEAGYQTACGVHFGVNTPDSDPNQIRRIIPHSSFELARKIIHRLLRMSRMGPPGFVRRISREDVGR
jgi:peptidoglycan/xylan/chitin deacetylase (PgdA/CDA1 family)